MFPILIYDILTSQDTRCIDVLTCRVTEFFNFHIAMDNGSVTKSSHIHSLRVIINTILFLRKINKPSERYSLRIYNFLLSMLSLPLFSRITPTKWDNNFWMKLDYQLIAKAAHLCGAYFTSLLCVEISLTNQR